MTRRARRWLIAAAASALVASGLTAPPAFAQDEPLTTAPAAKERGADQPTVDISQTDMTERLALAERKNGEIYYRIPAITATPKGDLIVAFDERPLSANDPGKNAVRGFNGEDWFTGMKARNIATWKNGEDSPNPNSIKQWRLKKGSTKWEDDGYVCKGNPVGDWSKIEGCSDPSYVVDWETGKIFNFHVRSYEAGIQESQPGNDETSRKVIQVEVSTSTDDGHNWENKIITATVTPDTGAAWRFAASGQGIQIRNGVHAGRLVQQFTRTHKHGQAQQAFSLYSDNGGETWTAGKPIGTEMDENKVVERSDGSLLLTSRNQNGDNQKIRWQAESFDGGQTWQNVKTVNDIVDGKTNGQPVRAFPNAKGDDPRAKVLLFANAQTLTGNNNRHKGTIWMSCDDGKTWPIHKVFNEDSTGYATITVQHDGRIGLVTEDGKGSTKELGIYYRSFGLNWLGKTCATMTAPDIEVDKTPATVDITAKIDTLGAAPAGNVVVEKLPAGWTAEKTPVTKDNAGAVTVKVNVPADANDGDYDLSLRYTGDKGAVAAAAFKVKVKDTTRIAREHITDVWANSFDQVQNRQIKDAFDGDESTFWHSQWKDKSPDIANNHHIVATLDNPYDLTKITYLAPQRQEQNGSFKKYEVLTASLPEGKKCQDVTEWKSAGTGTLAYNKSAYLPLTFDAAKAKDAQCVKIHVTGEQTPSVNAAAAEIRLYGEQSGIPSTELEPAIVSDGKVVAGSEKVALGESVTFAGTGFAGGESVSVFVDDAKEAALTAKASGEGKLDYVWKVAEGTALGEHTVKFVGEYSTASASVRVIKSVPWTELEPAIVSDGKVVAGSEKVALGESVTFAGTGFAGGESVSVFVDDAKEAALTAKASGEGKLDYVWKVAEGTALGEHTVKFVGEYSTASASVRVIKSVPWTELEPAIVSDGKVELDKKTVEQGSALTITGKDFAPNEAVKVTVHSDPVTVFEGKADDKGGLVKTWTVPADFAVGTHTVRIDGAYSAAEAKFEVKKAPEAEPATPEPTTPEPTEEPQPTEKPVAEAPAPKSKLAHTGMSAETYAGAAAMTLMAGAALVTLRRRQA
ncbi:exo-alpha-sialidase [Trueperella pecoris]|uniref:exo-alpha-sialidase n=1 Tax=Trueperella pecoris TaxID=2733571 RepID=A0A7M1R047_9ACTO|nr:exo-alpha-sialidase [Trueperella pecoris]QOR47712.1 exo-alpha-sialidase [Trueperella pecoris]